MKDHQHYIVWLDYFNSSFTRSEGRRIALDKAIKNPSQADLIEAAQRLGYEAEVTTARHPKRSDIQSHYISIERRSSKSNLINELARNLAIVRGESKR